MASRSVAQPSPVQLLDSLALLLQQLRRPLAFPVITSRKRRSDPPLQRLSLAFRLLNLLGQRGIFFAASARRWSSSLPPHASRRNPPATSRRSYWAPR